MKRLLLAAASALVLAAALVPSVLAADGSETDPVAPTPSVEPAGTPEPPPTPVPNGEIVIDPTFITEIPDPTATPAGAVAGATGRPRVTPPATDTFTNASAPSSASLQVLSVLAVAVLLPALLVGLRPGKRGT
jgi:hypothetical protein